MGKNKKIIIILLILAVMIASCYLSIYLLKEKNKFEGKSFTTGEGEYKEVLGFSGIILDVNITGKSLIVKPTDKENTVRVIISESTRLVKLIAPFDENNSSSPGTQFASEEKLITISDLKKEDQVLVLTKEGITGKTEINDVSFIQVLP
jgi:hypothetical protein